MDRDSIGGIDFMKIELRDQNRFLSMAKNIFGLKWRTWSIKTFFAYKSVQSKRVFNRFCSNPLRLVISRRICSSIDQELVLNSKLEEIFTQGRWARVWQSDDT